MASDCEVRTLSFIGSEIKSWCKQNKVNQTELAAALDVSTMTVRRVWKGTKMVSFTNEAIEFLLQSRIIVLNSNGYFEISKILNALSKTKYTDEEVYDCIKKAEHVARWFWRTGKVETVYIILGVRP